jgi:hypothetical protein
VGCAALLTSVAWTALQAIDPFGLLLAALPPTSIAILALRFL